MRANRSLPIRNTRAHVLLGRALGALGQREEALASFDGAITLAPDLPEAHSHRADVLSALGRNVEAIESCDRALTPAPDLIEDRSMVEIWRRGESPRSFSVSPT
ncbi:MAG: tetratricopeptide repeat protein [Xanthobacteraceae bacterium]